MSAPGDGRGPTGPDRYGVVGHPVAHSRSPFIHARFAELTGQALHYGRLPCEPDGFERTVRAFAASAEPGFGAACGCNVTVPFKFEVPALAARLTPRAALAQACNTLRFDPAEAGGWYADNTDGVGLVADIAVHAGVDLRGRAVLLVGAGGAAAGVLGPLLQSGLARLVLANRTLHKAQALVAHHADCATQHGVELQARTLADAGTGFDVVVNATAASLGGAAVPVRGEVLRRGGLALDMMYGPAAAPFLAWATEHGAAGRDGLGMLVEQAAEAFFFWRGVRPETAGVLRELRAHIDGAAA
jgi:shikimate dehydrogenase